MHRDITVFEAAALADCRRHGVAGYDAGNFRDITTRHGIDPDRLFELWDAELRARRPPAIVIHFRSRGR